MHEKYIAKIAQELKLKDKSVKAVVDLLDGGATVPFISRYRKEATGSLDEVTVTAIRDRITQLRELDKRRETILESIRKQGKLTEELKAKILAAATISILEDIYLPYKPKRRTRATVAKEKGLEPLAKIIMQQGPIDVEKEAAAFVNEKKKVKSVDEAISGARDIIAEWINEHGEARARIRKLYFDKGKFRTKIISGKEEEGKNYRDYYDWQDEVARAPSHRVLASRRGEKEKILRLWIEVPEDVAIGILENQFIKGQGAASEQVRLALRDSFKRLLAPSMETEVKIATKIHADQEAIKVFAKNLRNLLMAPPLGAHYVMAIDPGFRTGCKVVCLDRQGKLLHYENIFPMSSGTQLEESKRIIQDLCERFHVEFVAIGNGTASRETELFVRSIGLPKNIQIVMVSETGASIYSASKAAREEFPKHDVTVRGAISIGRRLMDPLAELVKIDPKSIGVGQYQYDVDQNLLKQSLDDVVISSVNQVGVELNTASKELLTYVSGLGESRARMILEYRNEHGPFRSREDLQAIPRLGGKAIEQAAGFLRIHDGINPLDASAVHPESYSVVDKMAKDLGCKVQELIRSQTLRSKIHLEKYITEQIGLPTLTDIYHELAKPGRDPRDQFEFFQFSEGIEKPEDLVPGMKLPGIVTNITNFGVFVDIGVHLDGLVHISQISERFIRNPHDVLKVHQKVEVTVLEVDNHRKRIALTMKKNPEIATPIK
jgi:uncharacterized protein